MYCTFFASVYHISLLLCIFGPVLTYGSDIWTLLRSDEDVLKKELLVDQQKNGSNRKRHQNLTKWRQFIEKAKTHPELSCQC